VLTSNLHFFPNGAAEFDILTSVQNHAKASCEGGLFHLHFRRTDVQSVRVRTATGEISETVVGECFSASQSPKGVVHSGALLDNQWDRHSCLSGSIRQRTINFSLTLSPDCRSGTLSLKLLVLPTLTIA
jgi:hypothetical protein